jgi:hypothetical protein
MVRLGTDAPVLLPVPTFPNDHMIDKRAARVSV